MTDEHDELEHAIAVRIASAKFSDPDEPEDPATWAFNEASPIELAAVVVDVVAERISGLREMADSTWQRYEFEHKRVAELVRERHELRQALWDIYGILGFDQDGDATPAAVVDLIGTVKAAAIEHRGDYDALCGATVHIHEMTGDDIDEMLADPDVAELIADIGDHEKVAEEATVAEEAGEPPAFVCPRCGARSWNRHDAKYGYCGACHDWTASTST